MGEQSGTRITFKTKAIAGLTTPGLKARMTVDDAINTLLSSTNLKIKKIGKAGFAIISPLVRTAQATELEGITITGERVERSVFDTSSSVTVVTGEELEEQTGTRELRDLWSSVPNVYDEVGTNDAPTIRGIDSNSPAPGFIGGAQPRTSVVVDGRALTSSELSFAETSLWDVDQIEAFAGPQTTSNGTNSIAGAIFINTRDPVFEPDAAVRAYKGSRNSTGLSAMINVPISSQLAIRATVDHEKQDSWRDAAAVRPFSLLDEEKRLNGRVKILFKPETIPGLTSLATFQYNEDSGPQTLLSDGPDHDKRISTNAGEAAFLNDYRSAVHNLTYDFGNGFTITNNFQLGDSSTIRESLDPLFGVITGDNEEMANETLLNFRMFNEQLSGVLGVSWLNREGKTGFESDFLGDFKDFVTGSTESYGVFGEATYNITERLHLTLGARWQRDQATAKGDTAIPFILPAGLDYDETFSAFLPRASIAYDLTPDIRVGALYSKGYNPGNVNQSVEQGTFPPVSFFDPFNEEYLTSYELFTRALFFNGRLEVTANAFYNEFEDYQLDTTVSRGAALISRIDNVDQVETYGLDLTAKAQVSDKLRMDVALGLLKTEIVEWASTPDVIGNRLSRAPGVTFSVGAQYDLTDELRVGGRVRYVGKFYGDALNSEERKAGDYMVVDLNASWNPSDHIEAFAFANNVFDTDYIVQQFGSGNSQRIGYGDPLEAGAGLKIKF